MKSVAKLQFTAFGLLGLCSLANATERGSGTSQPHLKVFSTKKVSPKTIREIPAPSSPETQEAHPADAEDPSSPTTLGLGVSTLPLTGTPGLSLLINLGGSHQAQFDFVMGSTNTFSLDANLGYRYHFGIMNDSGIHLGFLARMSLVGANAATLNLGLAPTLGMHLSVTADHKTQVAFEAGPELAIAGGNVDFRFRAFSPLLGLSIHRLF